MDDALRSQLIERYRSGYQAVVDAMEKLGPGDLDSRESPSEWSPREIVHHLADAEMRSAIRLRQLIAEDAPTIVGYDEELYAKRLHYDRPLESSLAAIKAARESCLSLLESLTKTEWERSGTHTESGPYSVDTWLTVYTAHAHDHAEQLSRVTAG